ncbi:hypothetical protein [Leisingera sp. MMG026]|uniref:hypothetical protein n=1 Tax=Leisingera sp. MMG026 TaxID=2909982 RepID=UPI001F41C0AE|nr:hypothetical protein [Leisingera sp. MMG026]MCF6433149.1 hypothetical protein [Leisingera sp. MMG026]
MDDLRLIARRREELVSLKDELREDIARCEEIIHVHDAELSKLELVETVLLDLRGARPAKKQPRIPIASQDSKQSKTVVPRKRSVASLIIEVLEREGCAMRPVEIDRFVRKLVEYPMHKKHVGKECCRLFDQGRLIKDEFTKEYSLPPNWDDNRNPTSTSSSQLSDIPAKGREAVPGGEA